MRIAVVGAGAVGGYYAARLAAAGHDVSVVARGAHLEAIRERGLIVQAATGDLVARVEARPDPAAIGPCELVLFAVKTYDNDTAARHLAALSDPTTTVLTLQNGVDSPSEAAAIVGRDRVLGGAAYIATAIAAPGTIVQTGSHHRIVLGEFFEPAASLTRRVEVVRDTLAGAGIEVEAHADGRVPLWEKFIYLAPSAGVTGAARLPIGPLRDRPATRAVFDRAVIEVEALARAEGIPVAEDVAARIATYVEAIPPTTRSSLLIDLEAGKRIEVEALQGAVVRRARGHGLDVPVMETLYAMLVPHAAGRRGDHHG